MGVFWVGTLDEKPNYKGHEDAYDVSHQSAFFDYLSYFVAKFEEHPMELYLLKLTLGFQQRLAY